MGSRVVVSLSIVTNYGPSNRTKDIHKVICTSAIILEVSFYFVGRKKKVNA